ncbi:MAG: NAD-dependent epimerase/dehydratase family protein, partial [Bacteroidetes bacterium]
PYAIAKIAGIKLCEAYYDQHGCRFISAMSTNLYGPNDSYDPENSHVVPALIRKFHAAKLSGAPEVEIWGDGSAHREFMHVDDLARACVLLMERYEEKEFVNIGVGSEISIRDLAELIREVVGYEGSLRFDPSRPNGTPRKLMDSSRLQDLGFQPVVDLRSGLAQVYQDFQAHHDHYVAGERVVKG